jgi:hypothetical protein
MLKLSVISKVNFKYMRELFSLIVLIIFSSTAFSQFAVINDPDGYTNVRKLPNINSEVVYKLKESHVFAYESIDSEPNSDWIKVYVQKNIYSLGDIDNDDFLVGYIHESRLQPIENLQDYFEKDFSFNYILKKFDYKDKICDFIDGKWISRINGRRIYGTDGTMPKVEVKDIKITRDGKTVRVSKIFFEDIFECENNFAIKKNKDKFIVYQWNSDGAGGYFIAWVIAKNELIQRFIFIP